ncbi:MAG: hypothetical protein Q7T08_06435 [Devosia sp.]|nr:hypothetical protein [Devosia sp.]
MAVPLLLAYSGLTIRLGAHPRCAMSTALIGAAVGLLVALGLGAVPLRRVISMLVAAVATVLAGVAAYFGKDIFVASYAEDGLAGHFWYYGWIGGLAGVTVLPGLTLWPGRRG